MFWRNLVFTSSLALLLGVPLTASVTVPADIGALVADAEVIAHGRIVSLQGRESGDGLGIETVVTLAVESYMKGNLGRELTFVVLGGQLGRYRSVVSGAPQFTPGEEVVLFLGARPPAIPHIVRLGQGAFRVSVDRRTGARRIRRQPLAGTGGSWQRVQRGAADGVSLEAFGAMVRTAMEKAR
jgi:hypothetical protein